MKWPQRWRGPAYGADQGCKVGVPHEQCVSDVTRSGGGCNPVDCAAAAYPGADIADSVGDRGFCISDGDVVVAGIALVRELALVCAEQDVGVGAI